MDQEGYATLSQGKVYPTEIRMKKRDGSEKWCHLVGKTINPKELIRGEFWFVEDITEKRNAEKKTQLDRELLLQADKMMSLVVLVSGVHTK